MTEKAWQIFLVVITALISGYITYWYSNLPDRMIYLEYSEYKREDVKKILGDSESVKIIYAGQELKSIGKATYSIRNISNKNLDKFKIYFEFSDKENLPIFHTIEPPERYPADGIKLVFGQGGLYVFEIEYMNSAPDSWQSYDFSFFFVGNKLPEISLKSGVKGIDIRKYEYEDLSFFDIPYLTAKRMWPILIIFTLVWLLVGRMIAASEVAKAEAVAVFIERLQNSNQNLSKDEIIKETKNVRKNVHLNDILRIFFTSKKFLFRFW